MTRIHCDVCGNSSAVEFADKSGFRTVRLIQMKVTPNQTTMDTSATTSEAHLCAACAKKIGDGDSLILMLKRNVGIEKPA